MQCSGCLNDGSIPCPMPPMCARQRLILQRAKQFGVEVKSAAVLDAAGESNS